MASNMWIIKLGGSLLDSPRLPDWLTLLAEKGKGKVVIVPGGGIFADQVREAQNLWHFNDVTAHKMALRAMEQFGLLLVSLEPRFSPARSIEQIMTTINDGNVPVWYPYDMVAENENIPESWDITSDSLSLWLTESLHFRKLAIIKSTLPGNNNFSADVLSQLGYLDKTFTKYFTGSSVETWWLSHEQLENFSVLLNDQDINFIKIADQRIGF